MLPTDFLNTERHAPSQKSDHIDPARHVAPGARPHDPKSAIQANSSRLGHFLATRAAPHRATGPIVASQREALLACPRHFRHSPAWGNRNPQRVLWRDPQHVTAPATARYRRLKMTNWSCAKPGRSKGVMKSSLPSPFRSVNAGLPITATGFVAKIENGVQ